LSTKPGAHNLAEMVALATRFAHGLEAGQALDAFSRAGATAVVLDRDAPPPYWELDWPVLAVEAPSPRTRASEAMLCSPDREESRIALDAALDTLQRAGKLGARFVGLWLGELRSMAEAWRLARERFLRDDLDERLARRLLAQRRAEGPRAVDAARRALDRLSRAAESEGLTLAVANGRRFIAVPDARELDMLLGDLRGAPVAPLFDVPAAHLPDVMGLHPLELTEAAWGAAPLAYVGDACGPLQGLPPGRGELRPVKLAEGCERVFSPWSGLTVEESLAAVKAL
jgi:hypothetical protein